ncbi:hypothetical protein QBC35DRAFT_254772 [Podospora australis]|uniref:Uncharacterized protein n=1 Tax=Podospora australis TaxID=1536484 RepID=A0AAN6WSB3_9PEZI|nr:hypothetical protein QBC35DRAFT_254772 [Podospora australis]
MIEEEGTEISLRADEEYNDDQTQYSDPKSLSGLQLMNYVGAFTDAIYQSLPRGFDIAEFNRVRPQLDELLKQFAYKISQDGTEPVY